LSTTSPALTPTTSVNSVGVFTAYVNYPGSGCTLASDTISITLGTQPSATVTPGSATYLCVGTPLSLNASVTGGVGTITYGWQGPVAEDASYFSGSGLSTSYTPSLGQGSSGAYTFSATYASGTSCSLTPVQTGVVTYNDPVNITSVGSPSVCNSMDTLPIAYSYAPLTFGTPNEYSIAWAGSAGSYFATIPSGTALPASPVIVSVTATPPAGVYTGTITFVEANNACGTVSQVFTVTVSGLATADISAAPQACWGYSSTVTFNGTPSSVVSYSVTGGSLSYATLNPTTGNFVVGIPASMSPTGVTLIGVVSGGVCASSIDTTVTVNPQIITWKGTTSSNWNTASNWNCSIVPTATDPVLIPSVATTPEVTTGTTAYADSLSLSSAASKITVDTTANLNLYGNLTSNGTIAGKGSTNFVGSTTQKISGYANVKNLNISNNVSMATTGDSLFVNGIMTLNSGVFTSLGNGNLVIVVDSFGTSGQIGPITGSGSISGNVMMRQWVQSGRRAYRFWGHPFTTSIPLSQLELTVDLTGVGGAANGFTGTATNAASTFWYDTRYANASLATDPGWMAFLTCNPSGPTDSNWFKRYEGIRVMFRGSKGQGLGGLTYTPSPFFVQQWGPVNTGSVSIPIQNYGTGKAYNQFSNPYPSPVDVGTVIYNAYTAGGVLGPLYYPWDPYLGTAGAYANISIGTSPSTAHYYLQPNSSIQVRATTTTSVTPAYLMFTESLKSNTVTTNLLRTIPNFSMFTIYDANYHPYDTWYMGFSDQSTDGEDENVDGGKPVNPDLNFYSWSADNTKLAADVRQYKAGKVIPLGFYTDVPQQYIIKVSDYDAPAGATLFLHDKLMNKFTRLEAGVEYKFNITEDPNTQGDNRFEIRMDPAGLAQVDPAKIQVVMTPNPATDEVNIAFNNATAGKTRITLIDVTGVTVYSEDMGDQPSGKVSISLGNMAAGIYMVEVTCGDQKVMQRLVKE